MSDHLDPEKLDRLAEVAVRTGVNLQPGQDLIITANMSALPLNGDMAGRYPTDAACAVWRTRDGGASWQALRDGLPQAGCYFTVLRQAMAGDARDPAGIYFGTNSGSVFASHDEGDTWKEVTRHLPTILSVEVLDRA